MCLLVALITSAMLTSCSDELSKLPTQYKVDGNVVVDRNSAETLLNGMYYTFAECGYDNYNVLSTKCSMINEIMSADFAGTIIYYQGAYMLENHSTASTTSYTSMFWNSMYSKLNAANVVIDQVGNADDKFFIGDRKHEILGEAYCMRALMLYDLLRYFGYSWDISSPYGDIIRTVPSKVSNLPTKRSSVADTYAQILSDLDYAIANAPSKNVNWYINSWFAKGLKARVLMLRGQGTDYSDAATLAKDVIDNSGYSLEDNVMDVFHANGINSKEVLFGIKPQPNQTDVYEAYYYRNSAQYLPTDSLLALFKDDPRLTTLFKVTNTTQMVPNADGTYSSVNVDEYAICKHLDPTLMKANDIEESQYQMRLTEMYLLRAEALVRSGGSSDEAKSLLKTILTHADVSDFTSVDNATTKEALLKQIFNEDMRNLFCESGREIDLMLRFGDIAKSFNPVYEENKYNVWPIPVTEFQYNGSLTPQDQNPGYATK